MLSLSTSVFLPWPLDPPCGRCTVISNRFIICLSETSTYVSWPPLDASGLLPKSEEEKSLRRKKSLALRLRVHRFHHSTPPPPSRGDLGLGTSDCSLYSPAGGTTWSCYCSFPPPPSYSCGNWWWILSWRWWWSWCWKGSLQLLVSSFGPNLLAGFWFESIMRVVHLMLLATGVFTRVSMFFDASVRWCWAKAEAVTSDTGTLALPFSLPFLGPYRERIPVLLRDILPFLLPVSPNLCISLSLFYWNSECFMSTEGWSMESLVVILNRVIYVEPWKHFINVPLANTPVSYLSILSLELWTLYATTFS
jgi:hypothetical protein